MSAFRRYFSVAAWQAENYSQVGIADALLFVFATGVAGGAESGLAARPPPQSTRIDGSWLNFDPRKEGPHRDRGLHHVLLLC